MLIVARHGETEWNVTGKMTSLTDISMNERGIEQVKQSAKNLGNHEWNQVFCSPLKRAQETCAILVPDHTPVLDSRLLEFDFGQWEGQRGVELKTCPERGPLYQKWTEGFDTHGGEPWKDFEQRCRDMMERYTHEDEAGHTLYCTHGYVLRMMVCLSLGAPLSSVQNLRVDNAKMAVFARERGRIRLVGFNLDNIPGYECAHAPEYATHDVHHMNTGVVASGTKKPSEAKPEKSPGLVPSSASNRPAFG